MIIPKDLKEDYSQVKFIKNTSKGVSSARNCGVLEAQGNVLLFIDNDVFLNKDFFAPALAYFKEDFFAAACCGYWFFDGKQLDGLKTLTWKKGFPRFTGNILNDKLSTNKEYLSFGVQGAYFFCSKEKFLLLKGFDTLLDPYMLEESDLYQKGYKKSFFEIQRNSAEGIFQNPFLCFIPRHPQTLFSKAPKR